ERICDFTCSNHCANRMPVADWFTKHDDVWNNSIFFKAPEVCSYSSVSGLHLIRDTNTTGGTHGSINFGEIVVGQENLPAYTWHGFGYEAANAISAHLLDNFIDVLCILV